MIILVPAFLIPAMFHFAFPFRRMATIGALSVTPIVLVLIVWINSRESREARAYFPAVAMVSLFLASPVWIGSGILLGYRKRPVKDNGEPPVAANPRKARVADPERSPKRIV